MMSIKNNHALIAGLFLSLAYCGNSSAQVCHNLYPSPEIATYDNNGHDLKGFILSNKKDFLFKGSKVNEYSKNTWGYMQIKNARVPSIDNNKSKENENYHKLNYSEYIDVTLAMYKTKDGAQSTWWARQCNSPKGPLVDMVVDAHGLLDMDYVRYGNIMSDIQTKKFTIVEYSGDTYNHKDYDDLLKNYFLIENGIILDMNDYGTIIDYYNNFLSKFSSIEDPLLEYKSFITFFETPKARYAGYFNVVNSKLAGKLEVVDIKYDRDKEVFVAQAFKKVTGSVVYVYGDKTFALDKEINTYAREHHIKVIRRKTTTDKEFNKDINAHQGKSF
ncbi:MAG: hypothetical protein ACHQD8_04245 [Chitinophagales bacterium]